MAFCKNCGTSLPEGATFCSQCGTPVSDTASQAATERQQDGTKAKNIFDTDDSTAEFDPADISQNKIMAVLSYIGILVLIPIFAAKDSKFARFHATQGLNVCVFSVAYYIVYAILTAILRAIFYSSYALMGVGSVILGILGVVNALASAVILVYEILGIVNACQGKAKQLPIIGKIDILGKFMK